MMNISSIAKNDMSALYKTLASGKRINSASDDAAGMAISKKLESMIDGIGKGTQNSYDMQNLVNTADGGMSNINDSLMRIRDLSVQASNSMLTTSDRNIIQNEIDELVGGISDMVNSTEFNTQNILDGSFVNKNTASGADGEGLQVSLDSMSKEALGLDGYNVSGNFDISDIDKAIELVNQSRSRAGSYVNRLDYTINNNNNSYVNQMSALSKTEDADMAKEIINLNTQRAIEQYNNYTKKDSMQSQKEKMNILF